MHVFNIRINRVYCSDMTVTPKLKEILSRTLFNFTTLRAYIIIHPNVWVFYMSTECVCWLMFIIYFMRYAILYIVVATNICITTSMYMNYVAENSCKYPFWWWIPLPFDGALLLKFIGIQWLVAFFHDIRHVPAYGWGPGTLPQLLHGYKLK